MTVKPLRRRTGSFGEPQAMPDQDKPASSAPIILIESKSQNGSEMVKNFAIVMQGDLRVRQGTVTVNVFRCNDFRPKYQLAGYLH